MAIEFREVTEENFAEFIELEVKPGQKNSFFFKSTKPNMMSLAQAHVYKGSEIYAIYDGDTMVGSIFYSPDTAQPGEPKKAWLTRFMIDRRYQGKGLGRASMEMLFDRIRAQTGKGTSLGLSYEPENETAAKLYASLGFEHHGDMMGDQMIVRKVL